MEQIYEVTEEHTKEINEAKVDLEDEVCRLKKERADL